MLRLPSPLARTLLALMLLFLSIAPALAQGGNGGAAAQQRLNVGDVLQVLLPGEEAFANTFQIDREGRIDLPEAGPTELAGLTLREAREKVRESLARHYRDLSRFSLVLRERKLLMAVFGYVKTPGPVELPAGANVQQALAAAGGLAPGAQLDRLQLRRAGQEPQTFDYKRYLDTGDTRLLPSLRPLDEVFVPASPQTGNVEMPFDGRAASSDADDRQAVRVFGEVNNAGSFAWRQGMTVMDALIRAGGVTRFAGTEQVRIIAGAEPRLFNLKTFLDTGNATLNPEIAAGTTIFIPVLSEAVRTGPSVIYMMGEVQRAGAFEVRQGTSFFDILANAGGPTRFADTRNLRIIRGDGRTVEMFDLGGFIDRGGGRPPQVLAGDAIFIPEKQQQESTSWLRTPPSRAVRVLGAVKNPGRLEWADEMSLLDLIAQAGGPNERGDMANVQILSGDRNGRAIRFDLKRFLEQGGALASLPVIRAGYTVMVPELPPSPPSDTRATWLRQRSDASIYVMGAVGAPGRYAFERGLSFLDIISAANGPTPAADIINIRVSHRGEGRDRITRVNLAAYFETGDDTLLPGLQPGDVIFVPDRNRNWQEVAPANVVRVLGAVGKPGRYPLSDGMTILDLLAEAGGPTRDALDTRIVVVNLSCCGNEARSFDLQGFARSGDFSQLPVVRQGDTIYVPTLQQSDWRLFFDNLRDVVSVLAIFALLKVI